MPSLLLNIEALLRGQLRNSAPVRQVLILEYLLPLGCCVHLTPLFQAIKLCNPGVQLILATRGLGLQVNRRSPFLDVLLETPDPFTDLRSAALSLRRQLRQRNLHPDCVLTGASDQRTRIALLGLLATSAWRAGYTQTPSLYRSTLAVDPAISLIRNNLRLTELIGCPPPAEPPPVRVAFSPDDLVHATALLATANPGHRPLIVLVTQNSGSQSTGWHTDRWSAVIAHAETQGCAVVFVGIPPDRPSIDALIAAAGNIGHSIAGQTTVPQLAAVLAQADLVISIDTGTMHVGRAAAVPMVVLGPSWQRPIEWLPLGVENVRILRGPDIPASPPGYRLDEISADAVIAAMDDILATYPPSPMAREIRIQQSLSTVDLLAG